MKLRNTLAVLGLASATACRDQAAILEPANASTSKGLHFDVAATGTLAGTTGIALAAGSTFCLEVSNGTNADGTPVVLATCTGSTAQQFTFDANTGAVRVFGDKCLDADMGRGQDGDKVQIWTCNGYNQQRWTATTSGQIVGIGGKCVDLNYGLRVPGTKVQLWTCYAGNPNQAWTGYAVSSPAPIVGSSVDTLGSAELPRVYLNTAAPAVTGGTISVPAGGDLQGALNAAQPGDQVVLAAGATYVGNFVLPAKAGMTGTQWITVRSSGSLPAEGTRVGPADAPQMAKVVSPIVSPAIAAAPGAQGWRLTGLEVTSSSPLGWAYMLVAFGTAGADQQTASQVPSRLVLDRSYLHGSSSFRLQRCMTLNSSSSAVIDSYLTDCHDRGGDSQAIVGWNGPGPYKIVNNRLEGAGEIVMFGGSDPTVPGVAPADIEIRRNYVTRPMSWKGVWSVKNLIELKTGQRVLVEGNVFENNWADAQTGFAFVWSTSAGDNAASIAAYLTSDVTFRYNVVRNTVHGFSLGPGTAGAQPMRRVTIANNVVTGPEANGGRMFQVGGGAVAGLTIANNTGFGGNNDVLLSTNGQAMPSFMFRDNVTGGAYTLMVDGVGFGTTGLAAIQVPAANVTGNVFAGGMASVIPAGNAYAANIAAVGLNNFAGGDLSLSGASPFRTAGAGSSTPGADVATVLSRTSGVAQ